MHLESRRTTSSPSHPAPSSSSPAATRTAGARASWARKRVSSPPITWSHSEPQHPTSSTSLIPHPASSTSLIPHPASPTSPISPILHPPYPPSPILHPPHPLSLILHPLHPASPILRSPHPAAPSWGTQPLSPLPFLHILKGSIPGAGRFSTGHCSSWLLGTQWVAPRAPGLALVTLSAPRDQEMGPRAHRNQESSTHRVPRDVPAVPPA